ncbi:MAG TPA: type 1 glutamine amidotransferase [Solirubrobacteraceae bacterium]|nr:type 1 glutamine amidotransferase [Solirubrobacteraceae bacterium]
MTDRALVLQHAPTGPPGLLGEWLAERGIPMDVRRLSDGPGGDPVDGPTADDVDVRDYAMVALLGSRFSPVSDAHEPAVQTSRRLVADAVEHDVPVLGLCYGGQMLASVLGGEVERSPRAELGWTSFDSDDPALVPPSPWLAWHWYRFTVPPGATEIARNDVGPQAFRHGRHLGVQFHPESTIEIVRGWAEKDAPRLAAEGVPDGPALLEQGRGHAPQAAANARTFFDGFWRQARNGRSN